MNGGEVDGSHDAHEGQDKYKRRVGTPKKEIRIFRLTRSYLAVMPIEAQRGLLGLFWKF